ncbi:hypothetical protein E3T26_08560 [Cryobacterium sp. TMT1-21]|uniref:hypothetical protein n=1 Tax=Cryobacterium sp. TMT1-21 TaxID=1259234 RepID=UPI00106949A8|nr:hypothetical protein [Cryobacterium sp. TMT1-21]TFD14165.1 hypothetical protein E3T26_08560 [Cryobacterium sp. TMT1-21]
MEESSPLVLGEPNEERVRWIKRLRQRGGLQREISGVPYALFGAHDWDSLVGQFAQARLLATPMPELEALFAALGKSEYFYAPSESGLFRLPTVVERRQSLSRSWGKSVRTLERLEERGALVLDYYFQKMLDSRYGMQLIIDIDNRYKALKWWMDQRGLSLPDEAWDVDVVPERIYRVINLYVNGYPKSAHAVAERGLEAEKEVRKYEIRDTANDA